jgi:hypothetical protein
MFSTGLFCHISALEQTEQDHRWHTPVRTACAGSFMIREHYLPFIARDFIFVYAKTQPPDTFLHKAKPQPADKTNAVCGLLGNISELSLSGSAPADVPFLIFSVRQVYMT